MGREHPLSSRLVHRDRLLDQHVLAGLEGGDRQGNVIVVRRCHDDRIDIVAREHLLIVAGGGDIAVSLAGGVQAAIEDVARGHKFNPGDAQRRGHVRHAHPARTDHGQADAVGGGDLAGRRLPGEPGECSAGHRPAFARKR